jgi:hypothetical protein
VEAIYGVLPLPQFKVRTAECGVRFGILGVDLHGLLKLFDCLRQLSFISEPQTLFVEILCGRATI